MESVTQSDGQLDRGDRPFFRVGRLKDRHRGEHPVVMIHYHQQIAFVVGGGNQLWFLERIGIAKMQCADSTAFDVDTNQQVGTWPDGAGDVQGKFRVDATVVDDPVLSRNHSPVYPRKLPGDGAELSRAEALLGILHIKAPAGQEWRRLLGVVRCTVCIGNAREGIALGQTQVHVNHAAFVIGITHVKRISRRSFEPAQLIHRAMTRQDADPALLVTLPHPVIPTLAHAFNVGGGREDHEDDVVLSDREIVLHCGIRRFKPVFADQVSVLVDHTEDHVP